MDITHALALLFQVIFLVLAGIFNKLLWWILLLGYTMTLGFISVYNQWEILFFSPLTIIGIISMIGVFVTAIKGEWI
jgi:hypothetical protein